MTRWTIEVRVRTTTRLVVGTGTQSAAGADSAAVAPTAIPADVLVSNIQLDTCGRATIPGASVRGACRAWMRRRFPDRDAYLFGDAVTRAATDAKARAGCLAFRWAHATALVTHDMNREHDARWDASRSYSAVDAAVALDPTSRTSAEHLLRYYRYVPAGVEFTLRVGARDVESPDIERVLAALLALGGRGTSPFALGSGATSGRGAFVLAGEPSAAIRVIRTTPNDVAQWLVGGAPQTGYEVGVPLSSAELTRLVDAATALVNDGATTRPRVSFDVALDFRERLLVKSLVRVPDRDTLMRAKRDSSDNVFVPGLSFRGVLRAQVARIARTLRAQSPAESSAMICGFSAKRGHGCGERDEGGNQRPVESLCVVCALFGAAGWKSPLECGDFTVRKPEDAGSRVEQTHVAIDRFTGGAANAYLYETDSQYGPRLSGAVSIDLHRLAATGKTDAAVGLLIMALRDLVEGDVSFGMGRSKGFGWCAARVAGVKVTGEGVASEIAALAQLQGMATGAVSTRNAAVAEPFLAAARKLASVEPAASVIPPPPATKSATDVVQAQATNDEFHNPYHFIPIRAPESGECIGIAANGTLTDGAYASAAGLTHALYRGGLFSGSVRCRLVAESEVVVGAMRGDPVDNVPTVSVFRADGKPAIPGSSLRGMFTSLGEAASNSALRVLERRAISRRANMKESLPAIGQVEIADGVYRVRPLCPGPIARRKGSFIPGPAVVDEVFFNPTLRIYLTTADIAAVRASGLAHHDGFVGICMPDDPFNWDDLKDVDVKGDGAARMNLKFSTRTPKLLGRVAPVGTRLLRWEDVEERVRANPDEHDQWLRGHLLILGDDDDARQMPEDNRHYEVFVPDPELEEEDHAEPLRMDAGVVEAFHALADEIFNPNETGTKQRPYEPLRQLRAEHGPYHLRDGDLVFFEYEWRDEKPVVTRVALSSIWRKEIYLGATTRSLIRAVSDELLPFNPDRRTLSVGEAVFGWVRDDKDDPSIKEQLRAFGSRVRFGTACPSAPREGSGERIAALREPHVLKLLASPKPPSPSMYLLPTADGKALKKNEIDATAMPQGRKYYLHGGADSSPWLDRDPPTGGHMHVRTEAIQKNSVFEFDVTFDNLTAFELGLLLYCLRPTERFRHKIGMGKPLGLGTVRVDVGDVQLVDRISRYVRDGLDTARSTTLDNSDVIALRAAFEQTMDGNIRQALRLLGESTSLRRVRYPYAVGNPNDNFYRWFTWNDAGPRHHLRPLTAATTSLPTLPVAP